MKKLFILSIVMFITLVGCNKGTTPVKENNKVIQKKTTSTTPTDSKEKSVSESHNETNSKPPLRTDGKWVQLGHRLYYLQGIVENISMNKEGKEVVDLLVEKTFQSESDGVVSPYDNGKNYQIVIKNDLSNMELKKKRVIIYGGQVTSNDQDDFIGGMIVYYQPKDKLVDLKGNPALLPPKDFPYQF
ncbi:hypothetical protein [Falsibacillus pallidus]|uniref:hypothetical protein n=1 Tax=Falsibacillus pallidus TaxID=493781 RepID=UPI003D969C3F